MICPECIRLTAEYERVVSDLKVAAQKLQAEAETRFQTEESQRKAKMARAIGARVELAREEIERHEKTHRGTLWE
jgi:F0F1-type ATP synthase membrane subunit b/b'